MANLKRNDLIRHLEKQFPTMVVFVLSPGARLDISHHTDAIAPKWMVGFNIAPVVQNKLANWFK